MSRWTRILHNDLTVQKTINWLRKASRGMRIEFKMPKRTTTQNDRMWVMLPDARRPDSQAHGGET